MVATMLDLDSLIDDTVAQVEEAVQTTHGADSGDPVWRERPVDLDVFVESPEHLHLPPLYARQRSAVAALLGGDPSMIFEEPAPAETHTLFWRKFSRSSNVARSSWAPEHGLVVVFKDGVAYRYVDAPKTVQKGLVEASSKGRFLAAAVKGRYRTERLEVEPDTLRRRVAQTAARQYQLAVLLWGKGSGKDYISSIVVCYLLHVLLCLRDPQVYFGLAPGEPIDIVNVAYNADQAKRVFFEKLKQRMFRWKWLRGRCDVFEAGRRKWPETAGRQRVEINDQEILFPRKDHHGEELGAIRAFSKHAENESYEGLNILAWVMDEASAFLSKVKKENASAIYQTLRTSAASRFQRRWVGFIISYPRHADDFTMVKVRESRDHPDAGIYGDGPAATWEINERAGKGEWVEVRPGHRVPVEFANDYTLDFEEALAKYECCPPTAKDALFKLPDRVKGAVQVGRKPLIEWEPIETRREVVNGEGETVMRAFAGVKITAKRPLPRGAALFFHGDPSRSSDAFGLGFAHGAPATVMTHVPAGEVLSAGTLAQQGLEPEQLVPWERDVTRTVVDALIAWRPDPRRGVQVDLLNVKDVLVELAEHYRGPLAKGGGSFDHYDSAEIVQWMQAKKLPVENEQWSNPFQHRIYRGARSAFYNDLVTLPDTPSITSEEPREPGAIYELLRVEELEGHKIDHPEGGSKDLADVIARLIEHVTGQNQGGLSFGSVGQARPERNDRVASQQRTVDPRRTPTPVRQADRDRQAELAVARPEGELVEGKVTTSGRMSFGSVGGPGRR